MRASELRFIAEHVNSHAADVRGTGVAQFPYQGAVGLTLFPMADLSLRGLVKDSERKAGRR